MKKRYTILALSLYFASVKEQKTDIASSLEALIKELQILRLNNDAQYTLICKLNCNIEEQQSEIRYLRKRLSKYEQAPKDRSNSSTPAAKENIKSEIVCRPKLLARSEESENSKIKQKISGRFRSEQGADAFLAE
ncbi:MAG: hypothetical protein ACK5L5_01960 [Bacteroidales bacterium]